MAKKTTRKKSTKRAATTKRKSSKKTGDMLLVGSKVKAALKSHGCNVSADALEGLNGWVHWLVEQAANRTAANGRKTVRNHDFLSM